MTQKKTTATPIGPEQALVSRISHLQQLLKHLPDWIPLDPPKSSYSFTLDDESLEERGAFGALSHVFEVNFKTFQNADIHFVERGCCLEELIITIKRAVKIMSDSDRTAFREAWLERLITAAVQDGATLPKKRKVLAEPSESASSASQALPQSGPAQVDASQIPETDERPSKRARCADVQAPTSDSTSDSEIIIVDRPDCSQKPAPARLKQGKLPLGSWKKTSELTEDERMRARAIAHAKDEEKRLQLVKQVEKAAEKKQAQHRDNNRERQQRFRDKKRAEKDHLGQPKSQGKTPVLIPDSASSSSTFTFSLSETSRPGHEDWRDSRDGTRGGARQARATRTNWFHPFLWIHIDQAMKKGGWSAGEAEKILKRDHPALFKSITRATIWKWVDTHASPKTWKSRTIANITNHHALTGSGRTGVLAKEPEIVNEIKKTLKDLRTSGIPLNVVIARSIILAIIEEKKPSLLDSKFGGSEAWVRTFFQSVMCYTPRMATRAAAHIPTDWEDVCERAFFCLVYAMKWEKIPPRLVVNVDQMGMYVLPSNSRTFHDKGAAQVDAVAKDEKRAYTLLVASTPTGEILPFQQVWAGKTTASLPKDTAPGMQKAHEYCFDFAVAASESNPRSHFSTLTSMKRWIEKVFVRYVKNVIEEDNLDEDQKSILYIDCYPVHAGEPFKTYIFTEHPNIIICFVPRNCTPVFQPADVGLQRPIKHSLKQSLFEYLAAVHRQQMASGLRPEDVKITTSLPKLRDASVQGLVKVYEFLKTLDGKDLIKKAWTKSVAKKWCLSESCLTSKEADLALRDYLRRDPALHDEIHARMGAVLGLEPAEGEIVAESELDHDAFDDTDVPLGAVIEDMLGEAPSLATQVANERYLVQTVARSDGGLEAANVEDNVWAYNDKGERWKEGELPTEIDSDK